MLAYLSSVQSSDKRYVSIETRLFRNKVYCSFLNGFIFVGHVCFWYSLRDGMIGFIRCFQLVGLWLCLLCWEILQTQPN